MIKTVSRQYNWQLKQMKNGNCIICGEKVSHYARWCDGCALKQRIKRRKAEVCRKWVKGGPGRPPLVRE